MEEVTISPVLIVDDNADNLVLISLTVQEFGYRVVTARDGEEAISVALVSRPQLILMDIAMPTMDGLDATRKLRQDPAFRSIPVVALTAFSTDGFRRAAAEAGFDGYLTKPVDFERLRRLMNALLSGSHEVHKVEQTPSGRQTGPQDPLVMIWRMFCAENEVPVESTPSELSGDLKARWQEISKNSEHFFAF
jgi:two-component system cell cycle response regulator DivK